MFRAQSNLFDDVVGKATDENLTSENREYILVRPASLDYPMTHLLTSDALPHRMSAIKRALRIPVPKMPSPP